MTTSEKELERELEAALRSQDALVTRIAQLYNEKIELRAALVRLLQAPGYSDSTENYQASQAARKLLAGSHGESVGVREADPSNTVGPNLNPNAAPASERSGSRQE